MSEPEEVTHVLQMALTPIVAARIVAVRDALIREDYAEAYHQLYAIADASFEKPMPWCQLEELAEKLNLSSPATPSSPVSGLPKAGKVSSKTIRAWADRHDLQGSETDLRCMFEDARTIEL